MVFGIKIRKLGICPAWREEGEDGVCMLTTADARVGDKNSPCQSPKGCSSLDSLARMSNEDIQEQTLFNPDYIPQALKFYRRLYRR